MEKLNVMNLNDDPSLHRRSIFFSFLRIRLDTDKSFKRNLFIFIYVYSFRCFDV